MKAVITKDGKERLYDDRMAEFLVKTKRAIWPKENKAVVETKEEKHPPQTKAGPLKKANVKK